MPQVKEIVKAIKLPPKRKVHLSLSQFAWERLLITANNNKVSMSKIVEYLICNEIKDKR